MAFSKFNKRFDDLLGLFEFDFVPILFFFFYGFTGIASNYKREYTVQKRTVNFDSFIFRRLPLFLYNVFFFTRSKNNCELNSFPVRYAD